MASVGDVGKKGKTISDMDGYDQTFAQKDLDKRAEDAQSVTVKFYNLITDFYEYGWGESFHFATRYAGEAFDASIARHEHYLAAKIGLKPGDKVLDVGCGVMGPGREIARFSGANVCGLNLNEYQVERCNILNGKSAVSRLLSVKQGDFMNIPAEDNTYDKIYAIEALCHAPDRVAVYKEIYSKLKPGGMVGFYEWVLTDKYDPQSVEHQKIKRAIEYGNSICELGLWKDVDRDLKEAGFIAKETVNLAAEAMRNGNDITWYSGLEGGCSLANIRQSRVGRLFTHAMVTVMETLRLAPSGTVRAHNILVTAAKALVAGGTTGIFTPMYLVVATKPAN
uniref:Methyltransferase n=1 Tax=Hirondellea gigas TaxID=1518452 RepID=A0A2P2I5V3_9CRUS